MYPQLEGEARCSEEVTHTSQLLYTAGDQDYEHRYISTNEPPRGKTNNVVSEQV